MTAVKHEDLPLRLAKIEQGLAVVVDILHRKAHGGDVPDGWQRDLGAACDIVDAMKAAKIKRDA